MGRAHEDYAHRAETSQEYMERSERDPTAQTSKQFNVPRLMKDLFNEEGFEPIAETKEKNDVPLVSVIMYAYNVEFFISEAIHSVLNQDIQLIELIIINDVSTDETEKKIQKFTDDRIVILSDGVKRGPSGSKNRAINHIRGRYIAFIDGADVWLPGKLREQIRYMKSEDCLLSFCDYSLITEAGELFSNAIEAPLRLSYDLLLYYGNQICESTVMIDYAKAAYFRIPNAKDCSDYAAWLQLLYESDISAVRIPHLYTYERTIQPNRKHKRNYKISHIWHVWRVLEKQPLLRSLGHFLRWNRTLAREHKSVSNYPPIDTK